MRRILAVWAGLGVVAPLSAQAGHRVEIGSRVRLRVVGEASPRPWVVEGTVERITGDTLTLRPSDGGPPRLIAPDRETELFTLERRAAPVGRGAAVGGGVGLIAGGVAGAAGGGGGVGGHGGERGPVVWSGSSPAASRVRPWGRSASATTVAACTSDTSSGNGPSR